MGTLCLEVSQITQYYVYYLTEIGTFSNIRNDDVSKIGSAYHKSSTEGTVVNLKIGGHEIDFINTDQQECIMLCQDN